jgi:DNA end-binding protein Ku
VKDAELNMAKQLIEGMTGHWSADQFRDSFKDEIMKLVESKAEAGETAAVSKPDAAPAAPGADVIDLTELLKRSLQGGPRGGSAAAPSPAAAPAKKATRKAGAPAALPEPEPEPEPACLPACLPGRALNSV